MSTINASQYTATLERPIQKVSNPEISAEWCRIQSPYAKTQPISTRKEYLILEANAPAVKSLRDQVSRVSEVSPELSIFLAESPNKYAVVAGKSIADLLHDLDIKNVKVNPSPEGGILFEFVHVNTVYFLIEVYNDGDFVLLTRTKDGTREAFDYCYRELIEELLERLG
jgi:hypothetical protein